jgi:peptidoglycan/LPS O-acetylase OafA/YrhL
MYPARPALPRMRLLGHGQLETDTCHSVIITLVRGLAAVQVAAAHLRAGFMPGLRSVEDPSLWYLGLSFLTGFAHQAVVVFFVLSGWLVGGSYLNKCAQPGALKGYALDRVTRLWTVLIPIFLLALAFAIVDGTLDAHTPDLSSSNPYSAATLAGNLVGLQTITLAPFGGNFPLWSLANESWYYLMFPLLVMSASAQGRLVGLAGLALCCALLPLDMLVYFPVWLLGALFSRVRVDCGWFTRACLLATLAVLSVLFRLKGSNDDLVLTSLPQDILLSLVFLVFLSSTVVKPMAPQRLLAPARALAKRLSDMSFTLYVVHMPVLGMVGWLGQHLLGTRAIRADHWSGLAVYLTVLAALLVFAYGFYRLFEARTPQVRRWVRERLAAPEGRQAVW